MKMQTMAFAVALGFSLSAPAAFAADKKDHSADAMPMATDTTPLVAAPGQWSSDPAVAERQRAHQSGTDELKAKLTKGKDKAFYRQELEKMGYAITAINSDEDDYLEYEVMKNGLSWEVQVDLKNGMSDKVDIANNVWKAKGTKEAMKDKNYKYVYPVGITANPELSSDRTRGKHWMSEKKSLEKTLGTGHDRNYYRGALEKAGYKVTKVNERDPENLELEVVKGDTSYEVQVDFDKKSMKSTKVDVSTNMWEAEATEKAKGEE